ncbi:hypothetical protein C5Q98_07040 [Fastidiosipila sanguinis]|uniref:Uncharacterized protein n=1 Tax=Fastidiosipila sanguinis TaxID=236753 RepID=A0A2S0KPN4_9FIRM|nr:hypothetical protein C5Q98_07040 [Fastidiosipila sanguinis]
MKKSDLFFGIIFILLSILSATVFFTQVKPNMYLLMLSIALLISGLILLIKFLWKIWSKK